MTLGPQRSSARHVPRKSRCKPRLALALGLLLTLALTACGGAGEPGESADAAPAPMADSAPESGAETGPESDAEASAGDCVLDPPAEAMACTMQYDPVCGCDGKTYGNACMARGAGVPRFEPGECPADVE